MRSGSLAAAGEGVAFGGKALALTMLFTVGLAVGLFVLLPLFLATGTTNVLLGGSSDAVGTFVTHLIEGLIRVVIFVGYLLLVSRSSEISRVFRYHGAEHMTIHTLEADLPLTVDNVRRYPTAHPRCGTEFLVVFIIVSILLFSFLPGIAANPVVAILGRILLVPVVAAVAYEILKWGAKRRDNRFARWLFLPGIWLQGITTKEPDDSMIEIAICSMHEALAANGDTAPAGSWDPAREPIPDAGELAKDMEARIAAEEAADADADVAATEAADPLAADAPPTSTGLATEPSPSVDAPTARTGGAPAEGA